MSGHDPDLRTSTSITARRARAIDPDLRGWPAGTAERGRPGGTTEMPDRGTLADAAALDKVAAWLNDPLLLDDPGTIEDVVQAIRRTGRTIRDDL